VTVVEEGTEFQGTLTSSCPIDVRGRVEGELKTPALTISASGAVHGHVRVGEVRSQGEISGEFEADRVELAGVVRDKTIIRARSFDVKLAAQRGKLQIVFGECELSVGDEPTENDYALEQAAPPAPVAAEAVMLPAPAMPSMLGEVMPAPEAAPSPEMAVIPEANLPALQAAEPAVTAEAAVAEDDVEDMAEDGADAVAAGTPGGKRKRRRKNGHEEPAAAGWSQPPSQPPPAN
jgi:cytoskeletal protein CcmA (bactofilin family)